MGFFSKLFGKQDKPASAAMSSELPEMLRVPPRIGLREEAVPQGGTVYFARGVPERDLERELHTLGFTRAAATHGRWTHEGGTATLSRDADLEFTHLAFSGASVHAWKEAVCAAVPWVPEHEVNQAIIEHLESGKPKRILTGLRAAKNHEFATLPLKLPPLLQHFDASVRTAAEELHRSMAMDAALDQRNRKQKKKGR